MKYLLTEQRHAFSLVDGVGVIVRLSSRPVIEDDERILKASPSTVEAATAIQTIHERTGEFPSLVDILKRKSEIIANVVTSPHHLGATMVTDRGHRMTELFGRLAPGATLEAARAELTSVHASMMREHPEAYAGQAQVQL